MSRIALSNTGDWKLRFDEQDVRGFDALDADGNRVGRVDHMIVDTDQKRVDAVRLEDGTEYPARDLSIGDGVVYLTTLTGDRGGAVTVYDDYGQVVERETVDAPNYDAHADAFRTHYESSYGGAGRTFEDYEPAYRYGYERAHGATYRDRTYTDVEDDLRSGYASTYADRDFDADRNAVRYGYTRAQHGAR